MALTYPTFAELDAERLAALRDLLDAVLIAYNPDLDLRRGVVGDLVLQSRALLAAAAEQAVLNALLATSLSEIVADPTLADNTAVDRVLGNFRLVRRPARKATGTIAIIISKLLPTTIAVGSRFTIGTQVFTADATYRGRTSSGDVVASTDRLIAAVSGGNYLFTVDAVAVTASAAGNVSRGATATPSAPPANFVRAYADTSFTGGADAESNTSLLNRLAAGLAPRAWSNRASVEAALRAEEAFEGLVNVSVVGHGDAEQLRSQHSLWPVAGGGRADLYVRTAALYQTVRLRKTAVLVSKVGAVGTWQFGLTRDDAPGFYEVEAVLLPSGDPEDVSFVPISDIRSADLTGDAAIPDIDEASDREAAYTAYQASTFQFVDTVTDATALTTGVALADYDVVIKVLPNIREIQDFWLDTTNAPASGDVLVRAVVPCLVTVAVTIHAPAGTAVDLADVREGVAAAINGLSFPGRLAVAYLSKVLFDLVPEMTTISDYVATGRILAPDGSEIHIAGGDLIIPTSPTLMVTPRTTEFFVTTDDIALAVAT